MRLPRTQEDDPCAPGYISCVPSGAITGKDTTNGDDAGTFDPTYYEKSGPHRYIGIAMVIVLAMFGIAFWIYWKKIRKSKPVPEDFLEAKLPTMSSPGTSWFCLRKRKQLTSSTSTDTEVSGAELDEKSTLPNPATPHRSRGIIDISEKEEKRERNLKLQSEPRTGGRSRVIKEVSGGVVMYTEAPKASLPGRDRYPASTAAQAGVDAAALPPDWQLGHVHGVRFEPKKSPRRHSKSHVKKLASPSPQS